MNHCLGDGHTSYSIYGMLGGGVVTSLEPERLPDSLEEITKMAGAANQSWMTSPAFLVGSLFHVLFRRVGKEPLLKHVDQDWIQQQKAANDPKTSGVPFITTNDILTSWLFDKADMQAALTAVNMRNRSQKGAGDTHAGNYEFSMLLMPQDAATPATLRQNMSRPGDFSCGRTAAPAGCYGSMRIKAAIITNWATFWKEFSIPGCTEILHLPVVDPQGPAYGYAIIFKPRADSLGVWISFRDKKTMTNLRQSEGRDGPLSADLIVASGSSDAATGTHAC